MPSPTRDAFGVFAQNLKSAIEKNDEAALRQLIAPIWFTGHYRADATQYNDVADALAAFRAVRQGAPLTLDLTRTVATSVTTRKLGERIVIARWPVNGREEFAYLYVSFVNSEWRWTALITGIPADQVLAQPSVIPTITPTAPSNTSVGHLAYMRGKNVYVRDLSSNVDALVADVGDSSQWDWTRDGSRAVFVRGTGLESEIWTINRDGSNARRLTNDNVSDGSPHWSPDGTQLLYEHNIQTVVNNQIKIRGEVWLMNADGSNKRKLTDGYDAAWSAEGQRIAFATNPTVVRGDAAAWTSYARNGIHLINAQGRNEWAPISTDTASPKFTTLEWQMSQARSVDSPQWSPDGREMTLRAHGGHGAYVTTNVSSGGFGKFVALFFDDIARGFSYSPDGNYITLAAGGLSGWETMAIYRRSAIGKDGVSGTPLRTLGKIPRQANEVGQNVVGFVWQPVVLSASPGRPQIAFALVSYPNNDQSKASVSTGIWLMDVVSGESKQLIADGAGPLFWLP